MHTIELRKLFIEEYLQSNDPYNLIVLGIPGA